ncbi:MAG: ABC transporter permease [Oscillospiraceae bacterium]|nr:ABC transporter permease [Oscillospiraceae bacterium]
MQHTHISAQRRLFDLKLGELWRYRNLVWLFTRRSFMVTYMQTVLGPLWLLIKPLLTSVTYVVLFGNIAKLSTDGVPQLLFYLSGSALWSFFSSCVTDNASTFTNNAYLFGKVYFPRLVMPVSSVLSNLILFLIQILLTLALLVWYTLHGLAAPRLSAPVLVPLILLQLGALGMGFGIIISSLTTKYRDLRVLLDFGVTLWMYATPVVYPLSTVSGPLRRVLLLNPVTAPMELYRRCLLGTGSVVTASLVWSLVFTLFVSAAGIVIFSRVERTFMDTV